MWLWIRWVAALGLLASTERVAAITFFSTGDPTFHTTAPTGALEGSGWQWQITGGFCGTVIGPHHLATVRHLGLQVGQEFIYQGLRYRALRVSWPDSGDLALLEVAGRIDSPAPLYTRTNEVHRALVLFGKGTQRGTPVLGPPPNGTQVRGWNWGGSDFIQRWGTNRVEDVYDAKPGDSVTGSFLVSFFSDRGGADLGTLSTGDSGGGAFIQDIDGRWKLAGINSLVESQFNTTTNGPGFYAALFDRRGFYEFDTSINAWAIDPDSKFEPRTEILFTRISAFVPWIQSQFDQPPAVSWPRLESASQASGPYSEHPAYAVTVDLKQIVANVGSTQQFFRLRSDTSLHLNGPTLRDGQLVFHYE